MPYKDKDDISSRFKVVDSLIDEGLRKRGSPLEERTEGEFRKRVQEVFRDSFLGCKFSFSGELQKQYNLACSSVPNINYSLEDISGFCASKELGDWNNCGLGIFVSALINRIIKDEDTITLKPRQYIFEDYIGTFLERGTIIVKGDVKYSVGHTMKGGKIIVEGGALTEYGDYMEGGELIIEGEVKGSGFNHVVDGHGIIKGIDKSTQWYTDGSGHGGICSYQKGGLIEILCDLPDKWSGGVGFRQEGGELKIYGNVNCEINNGQKGGKTYVKGNVNGGIIIGWWKEGGETVIDGNCLEKKWGGIAEGVTVGLNQKGGLIRVMGYVHGPVAFDGWPNAEIIIGKNVYGDIGDYRTSGTKVTVKGSVTGNVGIGKFRNDDDRNFFCTVKGSVKGDVGDGTINIDGNVDGNINSIRPGSHITIKGNVTGEVGGGMHGGEIRIKGGIGKIGKSFGGHIYQNGRDVTYIPLSYMILNAIFKDG